MEYHQSSDMHVLRITLATHRGQMARSSSVVEGRSSSGAEPLESAGWLFPADIGRFGSCITYGCCFIINVKDTHTTPLYKLTSDATPDLSDNTTCISPYDPHHPAVQKRLSVALGSQVHSGADSEPQTILPRRSRYLFLHSFPTGGANEHVG